MLPFAGHVFDLTDIGNWYVANGLVIHNSQQDERVRPTHIELEGVEVRYDQPFTTSGGPIAFPGDPAANVSLVANCRCWLEWRGDDEAAP